MEKKSSIVRNIAIGVAVGAAVTMLKKDNREKIAGNVRKARTKVTEMRENSGALKGRMMDNVQTVSAKSKEMAELKAVKDKLEEIKKLTPAVVETLKETRDIFNKKKQELLEKTEAEQQNIVLEASNSPSAEAAAAADVTEEADELVQDVPAAEAPVMTMPEQAEQEEIEEENKQTV